MTFFTQNNKYLLISFLVLFLSVIIAYFPSVDAPFYLDDRESIETNELIKADSLEPLLNSRMANRIVGYATLWANFHVNGLEPAGYHMVNIFIHLISSLLVYFLTLTILNFFTKSDTDRAQTELKHNRFWAFAVAALWALHPLNSQTVIYVVQRLASIVSIFMMLSVIFYIKARQSQEIKKIIFYGVLVFVCAVAGYFSKQNYVAILLFLFLWELFTAQDRFRNNLVYLALAGFFTLIFIAPFITEVWQKLDEFTRDPGASSRTEYFYTQMLVLWNYIFRFFYPINLQLNIGVELKTTFEPVVAFALLAHICLIAIGYRFRKAMPLFFVGILLFYSSHSIESFIFPIKDLAFEHRTYVGNIGLVMCIVALVKSCFSHPTFDLNPTQTVAAPLLLLLIAGGITTHLRAIQWQDQLAFHEREVELSPEHQRTHASYGTELLKVGRFEEAEKHLRKSIDINIANNQMTFGVINAYVTAMYQQKKYQEAVPMVMLGLKYIDYPIPRSMLLSNLAVGYIYMGFCDFALGLLTKALELNPNNADARTNKAYCEERTGIKN